MQAPHPPGAIRDHSFLVVLESFLSALVGCGIVLMLGFFLSL